MNPAPSVILFSVLSGSGFGLLAFLALGFPVPQGWTAFWHWGLGYALAVGGLLSATFHLGNPQRAALAFTQWRTSWLSREGWAAVAALLALAVPALSDILGSGLPRWAGLPGAALGVATVLCTAMIYAQLRTVPRWNHWTTPATFLAFMLAGGALLAGLGAVAVPALALVTGLLAYAYATGDARFAARGQNLGTATGLGALGEVTVFEPPHTGGNYLMREMIFVVGRKHVRRLQVIAVLGAGVAPALLVLALPPHPATFAVASLIHLTGGLAARWLFFAQAEHVVGLYYGAHGVPAAARAR